MRLKPDPELSSSRITAGLLLHAYRTLQAEVWSQLPTIAASEFEMADGEVIAYDPTKKPTWKRDEKGEPLSPQKLIKREGQRIRFEDAGLKPEGGVNNILKLYQLTTPAERAYWGDFYHNGWEEMVEMSHKYADDYAANYGGKDLEPWIVAGLVAILSPNMNWDKNLDAARRILQGNKERNQAYPAMVKLAVDFAKDPDVDKIRGEKTGPFFDSFVDASGQDDVVVVDGHMANIYNGIVVRLQQKAIPPALKTKVQEAVRKAAAKVGISAQKMQAIAWYSWRQNVINAPMVPGEDHPPPPALQMAA